MANQQARPNQCSLKAGPLESSHGKRAKNLRSEEGGGSEASVAGHTSGETEAEVSTAEAEVLAAEEATKASTTEHCFTLMITIYIAVFCVFRNTSTHFLFSTNYTLFSVT
jgi:hypothetical protein